jgi:hypothetical protein
MLKIRISKMAVAAMIAAVAGLTLMTAGGASAATTHAVSVNSGHYVVHDRYGCCKG